MFAASAAVVVVGLEIDAISAADFLTSRTRGLADAVDAGLSRDTARPASAALFGLCALSVGLAAVGFVVVGVAVVGGACRTGDKIEVGEVQTLAVAVCGSADA